MRSQKLQFVSSGTSILEILHSASLMMLQPRNGNVIHALVPKPGSPLQRNACVCLVLGVWINSKKPRLATKKVPLDHAVGLRALVMRPRSTKGSWECDGCAVAWVLRPQSVIAVLAVEAHDNSVERCQVTLTEASLELIKAAEEAGNWWPNFDEDDNPDEKGDKDAKKKPKKTCRLVRHSPGNGQSQGQGQCQEGCQEIEGESIS